MELSQYTSMSKLSVYRELTHHGRRIKRGKGRVRKNASEDSLPKDNQNEFRTPRKCRNICMIIDVFTYVCWYKHIYLHVCVCAWAYILLYSGERVMKQNIWVAGTIFLAPPTKDMAKDSWDTTEWMLWQLRISFCSKNNKKDH